MATHNIELTEEEIFVIKNIFNVMLYETVGDIEYAHEVNIVQGILEKLS
jgi:hypothetical protein